MPKSNLTIRKSTFHSCPHTRCSLCGKEFFSNAKESDSERASKFRNRIFMHHLIRQHKLSKKEASQICKVNQDNTTIKLEFPDNIEGSFRFR